jgi:hypothetical protein
LEWSIPDGEWIGLAKGDKIRDRVFAQPLEIKAIKGAEEVGQLVSKAQLTKKEPHLMGVIKKRETKAQAKGLVEGEAKGLAKAISITLDAENSQAILECQDMALLERLFDKAIEASSASEILAELEKVN